MSAVEQIVFEMQIEREQFSDTNPAVHYHVSDGWELTIVASLDDLGRYLQGVIDDSDGDARSAFHDQGFACIMVDSPPVEGFILRTRSCADPTCEKVLRDYYL